MKRIEHELRLSETVRPYGVGSIVDVSGASLVAPDTSWWKPSNAPLLRCERLEAELSDGELRMAPYVADRPGARTYRLEYRRFPEWRFCDRCARLSRQTGSDKGSFTNRCQECRGGLVPVRFVAMCEGGSHVQDIQWFAWVHRGRTASAEHRQCRPDNTLRLRRVPGAGESLAGLVASCDRCSRSRSLSEVIGSEALTIDGFSCFGKQPWQSTKTDCPRPLRAVLRTSTSGYLADTLTALDIPEEQEQSAKSAEAIRQHAFFAKLQADPHGPFGDALVEMIAQETGLEADIVRAVAESGTSSSPDAVRRLKAGEWSAFVSRLEVQQDEHDPEFIVRRTARSSEVEAAGSVALAQRIRTFGAVDRVRVVSALRGFRRVSEDAEYVSADLRQVQSAKKIYPSMEQFGEGIIMTFDEGALADWESHPLVQRRVRDLAQAANVAMDSARLPDVTPRWVALHTLSHLLLRRLAFASGYTSASLSERIYAHGSESDPEAGIFIYTASGDAQGTLGGLARLARPRNFIGVLLEALEDAEVCSNDPVCLESGQAAVRANLAACHGCALVAETSCEVNNRFLDRALLLGGAGIADFEAMPGLLERVVSESRTMFA
ncbi:DUF1998 domain-containing protein [Agrococcus jejuensis]|uniref:MrfA-like Zn-binding domain-containing protein n=1 Tax=Agrococcus jejuensis TaxID=399736 RepID=A0A1G8CGL0_9MICO|nr:DUF1998 domain-containing protein [Agrococcus jejuensis]SDH44353.1 protein of unknown function [Agrococcus jejuensis]